MKGWLTCLTSYARRTNLKSGETEYLDALKVTCNEVTVKVSLQ